MAKQMKRDSGPFTTALTVLGIGVVAAVVVGLIYGLLIDNIPRGLGQGGAVVLILAAIVGVSLIYRTDVRRKQAGR
jgi:F0F1-type ATP synthase assembly protein I